MSDLPQPADRRQLRVSDADREQAAEVLRQAAGDGRITFDELDQRLDAAYAARTYGDLTEVTADLPAPGQPTPGALATAPGTFPAARIGGEPGSGVSIAILSGVDRGGTWVVPPRHSVVAVLGGVQLDLREARFSQREVTIDVFTLMGGVDIMVGEDVDVDVSGFGIMGGFDHRASGPGLPGAPKVRVVGLALMGGVNVRRGQPGQDIDQQDRHHRDHHHEHHHRDHLRDRQHREIGPARTVTSHLADPRKCDPADISRHNRRAGPVAPRWVCGKPLTRRDGSAGSRSVRISALMSPPSVLVRERLPRPPCGTPYWLLERRRPPWERS